MSIPNIAVSNKPPSKVWIVALTAAMFLPMMGRGFIHDDYLLLSSSAFGTIRSGLTRADIFYTPVAWLTFKADWLLWGLNPFALAAENLLLHIVNILLLYHLALRISKSSLAAWWAAFGFALLFPANTWAVMWVATRAHLLVTAFDLAAMIATLWFIRTKRSKLIPAVAIAIFSALSIFAKETGITIPVVVGAIMIHARFSRDRKRASFAAIFGVFFTLAAIAAVYLLLRAQSGAVTINFGDGSGNGYSPSPSLLIENTLRYSWRTFGLLSVLAVSVVLSRLILGQRPKLTGLLKSDVLLSAGLFMITIAPVLLMRYRSGIYTYLPGISAALLFGLVVRALYENGQEAAAAPKRSAILASIPIVFAVVVFVGFTFGLSRKWKVMAETDTLLLKQVAAQQRTVPTYSLIVLSYDKIDEVNRFPDGFSGWGFGFGIKLMYRDPSAEGVVVRKGATFLSYGRSPFIHFEYRPDSHGRPQAVRTGEEIP